MRRFAAAAFAATALVAFLFLGRGAEDPPALDDPGRVRASGDRPGPEVESRSEPVPGPGALPEPPPAAPDPSDPPADGAPPAASARLAGVVYAAGGSPAAGARVELHPPGAAAKTVPQRAGPDGSFSFAVERSGKGFRLEASRPDLGQSASRLVDLPDLEDLPEVELRLEARAVLEGRVLDAAGLAVEGASVRLVHLPGLAIGSHEPERAEGFATTDAMGRWRIDGVEPGAKRLVVQAASRPGRWIDLALEPGESRREIDVDLPPGTSIAGRVTDAEDRPLSGAIVRLVRGQTEPGDPGEERHTRADATGAYRLEGLDPRRWYRVEVYHPTLGRVWSPRDPVQGSIATLDLRVE